MKKKLLLFLFVTICFSGISQNNYLDFDGVNDNVNVASSGNLLSGSSAITLSCKVYPKNLNPSFPTFSGFAGYRNESNFDFYIVQLSATQIEARFRNSSGTAYTVVYNGLVVNQWNHFFLVYNGSTLKIYKGAVEVASGAASGSVPASNTSTFKIGNVIFSTFNFYHKGYIDEVSLWNKALSPTEISAIITNNGEIASPDSEANLKVYYKFNQGIAYGANPGLTTLIDEKGAFDGTLSNFALSGNTSNWGSQDPLSTGSFDANTFVTYPNPASSQITFKSKTEINDIKISDLAGRKVLHFKASGLTSETLEISFLKQGIYFATINGSTTLKFSKR